MAVFSRFSDLSRARISSSVKSGSAATKIKQPLAMRLERRAAVARTGQCRYILPVVAQRSIQRIVVEALRPSTRAASRLLSPSSTSATARALRSFEYPFAIARPCHCCQSNSNLICELLETPLLFRFTSTENRSS